MTDAVGAGTGIGAMPLYIEVHRIYRELAALGIQPDQALTPDQLYPFDQFHYHGIDAVRASAGLIGLGRESRVLEIGSGLGGPARYLAQTVGCHVTALELQQEMHDVAVDLTRRCGLSKRVVHVRGDALTQPLEVGRFDAAVSWLACHHIPDRPQLLERLRQTIKPGGHVYIEDLALRDVSSREDFDSMRTLLHGVTLTDAEDFAQALEDAGFEEIDMTDMSPSWTAHTAARVKAFRDDLERYVHVHGETNARRLEAFYAAVDRLFARGSLGGVRLVARRSSIV
jgi:cyclopropane fatty-acyl-phospholipid synthase-like methyltransferase